eukprot:2680955-Pleurochrysis_carterae.AAC.1
MAALRSLSPPRRSTRPRKRRDRAGRRVARAFRGPGAAARVAVLYMPLATGPASASDGRPGGCHGCSGRRRNSLAPRATRIALVESAVLQ